MMAQVLYWGLMAHFVGDYLLQSDWMAEYKTSSWWVALVHATTYGLPFCAILFVVSPNLSVAVLSMMVIVGTHAVIDRFRLARYLVWVKNMLAPKRYRHPWAQCWVTGYHQDRAIWMSVWLMIIADNTLHVLINSAALSWVVSTVGGG